MRAALEAEVLANASPEQRFRAAKEAAEVRTIAKKEESPAEAATPEATGAEDDAAAQMKVQAEKQRAAAQASEVAAATAARAVKAAAETAAAAAAEEAEAKAAAAEKKKQRAEAAAEAERAAKDAEAEARARANEASKVELAVALQRHEDPPIPTKLTKAEKAAAKRAAKEQRAAAEAKRKAALERQVLEQLHGFTAVEESSKAPTSLDAAASPAADPPKESMSAAAETAAKDAKKRRLRAPLRPDTGLSWTSVVVGGDALRTEKTDEVAAEATLESVPSLHSSPSATSGELSSSAPAHVKMSPALLPYPVVRMPSPPRVVQDVDAPPRPKATNCLEGEKTEEVTEANEWLEAHFALQRSASVGVGGKSKGRARAKHAAGKGKKPVAAK